MDPLQWMGAVRMKVWKVSIKRIRASFTKQGKLGREHNSKTAPEGKFLQVIY